MTVPIASYRTLYYTIILLFWGSNWFLDELDPRHNILNWAAAGAGAFVIRFAYPDLPWRVSIGGWLAGFILACLYAPSLVESHAIDALKPAAVWGTLGLIGDAVIQLVAWLFRVASGVGKYAEEHPGDAFDQGLERAEKLVNVWVRIKTSALDLINTLFNKKP